MILLQKLLFFALISVLNHNILNTSFLLRLLGVSILFVLQLLSRKKSYQYGLLGVFLVFSLVDPSWIVGLPLLYVPVKMPWCILPVFLPLIFKDPVTALLYLVGLLFTMLYEKNIHLKERTHHVRDSYEEETQRLNASLYQNNQQRIAENKMLIMEERNRISSELHDAIGHTITSSLLQIEAIKLINQDDSITSALDTVSDSLSQGMDEIRHVLHNLKKESILLDKEIEKLFENINLEYDLNLPQHEMAMDRKFTILTLVKEAVTNTLKHSDATKMWIQIISNPAFDALKITDNGSKKVDVQNLHYGMGLIGMHDIVEKNGGIIRFHYNNGFEIYMTLMKEES